MITASVTRKGFTLLPASLTVVWLLSCDLITVEAVSDPAPAPGPVATTIVFKGKVENATTKNAVEGASVVLRFGGEALKASTITDGRFFSEPYTYSTTGPGPTRVDIEITREGYRELTDAAQNLTPLLNGEYLAFLIPLGTNVPPPPLSPTNTIVFSGKVMDKKTKEPVEGAVVVLTVGKEVPTYHTVSSGMFYSAPYTYPATVPQPTGADIRITRDGYRRWTDHKEDLTPLLTGDYLAYLSPDINTMWRMKLFVDASGTLVQWDVKDGLPRGWKDHFVPESNLVEGHPESGSKQNMGLEWDDSNPVSLSVGGEILHRSSSELFLGAAVATRVPFERRLTGKLDWWNRVTILEFEERQYPMLGPVLYAGLWQNTKLRAAALLYYYEQTFVDYTGVNVVNGSNYSVALPERDESGVGCRLEAGINVPFGKSGWAVPVTAFYEQSGADVWSAGLGLGVTFGVDIGQSQ